MARVSGRSEEGIPGVQGKSKGKLDKERMDKRGRIE